MGAAHTSHTVGRERELQRIERFLGDVPAGFAALLFEGDAGIGKTTVFREALALAESSGLTVLVCRAAESEATFSFAALGDLLQAVPRPCWEAIPAPQRRALEVALLEVDPGGQRVDQRAVAAGVRSLVIGLAAERPTLLAIDDVQWLDPASAAALEYAIRRLGGERVGVLATRRSTEPARLDLEALVAPEAFAREPVGPLSRGALQRLLRERFGEAFPRSTLVRIHHASGGNPLFAQEIGRVLAERRPTSSHEPLPVPDDVRKLVRERVVALPDATRDLLLAAALLSQPSVGTLTKALGRPTDVDLEPAERAGIAALEGSDVTFAHPLHAAAVVATATAGERRRMHLRLADSAGDPEARALHLAFGADRPSAGIAAALEEGAGVASGKGSLHTAAELLERARSLTPASAAGEARSRGIRAAELHLHAGDRARARMLLEELLTEPLAPALRADALRLLAELCFAGEDIAGAERLLVEALASADDPRSAARTRVLLLYLVVLQRDFARAAEYGRQALADLSGSDDGPLLAEALTYCAQADYLAGRGVDWNQVERALALEDPNRIGLPGLPPSGAAACLMMYVGRHDEARRRMEAVRVQLQERGDEADLGFALLWLSWLELRCGDFSRAAGIAEEAIAFAALTGSHSIRRWALAQRALVDAHQGDLDGARRRCAEASSDGPGIVQVRDWIATARALAGVSIADYEAAWQGAREVTEAVERLGVGEPVLLMFLPDVLEALVARGELDRAEALLDAFEQRGRELDRTWALATGGRCRGLLLGARGDLAGADAALADSLAVFERLDMPFERARTLLVRGSVLRRLRQRAQAARTLEAARAEFERMGAVLWVARARSELERVGKRRSRSLQELTLSERRVAELAAEGLSNKEIAARLFVSVHTIEVHLSHAYAKLGVRSRAQLARRLQKP